MDHINQRDRIILIILSAVFIALAAFVLGNKTNLHGDEVFTYGLSNHPYIHTFNIKAEEGTVYTPADILWNEYMQVQPGHQFDYRNVWKNQEADVHPPLYYALVHTISSFFPGRYSVWFAGSVNVVFGVLLIFCAFFLSLEIFGKKIYAFLTTVFFMCSAGMLPSVSYLRMYVMAMFWCCLATYLLVRYFHEGGSKKFYRRLYAVTTLGILTHYYFLIYLFFLACVFCVMLLTEKQYKNMGKFCAAVALGGVTAIAVFPRMLRHIFGGQRGAEAASNLTGGTLSDYLERLKTFFDFLNGQLFGNLGIVLAVAFILAVVIRKKRDRKMQAEKRIVLLLIPSLCYFLLVSKIAAYISDRYLQPIYPMVFLLGAYALYVIGHSILSEKRAAAAMAVGAVILTAAGLWFCQWPYLYRDSEALLQHAANLSDHLCVYIYDDTWQGWKVQPFFYEVRNYRSVVFVSQKNLELLDTWNLEQEDGIVVSVINTCDQDAVFEKVKSIYGEGIKIERIGNYSYTTSYVIENNRSS